MRRSAATAATRSSTRAATSRSRRSTTSPTSAPRSRSSSRRPGWSSSGSITRSAPPARPRSTSGTTSCWPSADNVMKFKYIVKNVAWRNGKTATFMPKPIFGDNGSGMHCHQSIRAGRRAACSTTSPATRACRTPRATTSAGCSSHAPSLLAFTNPTVNSYHRLVPGFEAPGQPGLQPAQPVGLHPDPDHRVQPGRRSGSSSAAPTPRRTRTSRSRPCCLPASTASRTRSSRRRRSTRTSTSCRRRSTQGLPTVPAR